MRCCKFKIVDNTKISLSIFVFVFSSSSAKFSVLNISRYVFKFSFKLFAFNKFFKRYKKDLKELENATTSAFNELYKNLEDKFLIYKSRYENYASFDDQALAYETKSINTYAGRTYENFLREYETAKFKAIQKVSLFFEKLDIKLASNYENALKLVVYFIKQKIEKTLESHLQMNTPLYIPSAKDVCERMLTYFYQYNGLRLYFAESIDKVSDNLKEVQPDIITAVPRLLEKIFDKIFAKGTELKGLKRSLFFWAIRLGEQYEPYGVNGWWYRFRLGIARKLIFSKWQEALGGHLGMIVCGSAALSPRLARIFSAAGLYVIEGYGLTETAPVVAVNRRAGRLWRIGTVGKPIDNVDVKIAEDGEILCKGENVMLGYYKAPELTAEAITDGYFHTGDIGELDDEGFLKITDRKKEMFKTSGGKYVSPQLIENQLKLSRFIEQVMVVGEGEKMPAAIIQLNFPFVKEWARRHRIKIGKTNEEIIANGEVFERVKEEVERVNKGLGQWEKIKLFAFTPDEWSIDAGHLTPTLKLKRRVIKEKYIDIYNSFYSENHNGSL